MEIVNSLPMMVVSAAIVLLAAILTLISGDANNVSAQSLRGSRGSYIQPHGKWDGHLSMDTAFVNITYDGTQSFNVYGISSNCYKCDYQLLREAVSGSVYVLLDTSFNFTIVIKPLDGGDDLCKLSNLYGENGQYLMVAHHLKSPPCAVTSKKDPIDTNEPVFVLLGVLAAVAIIWVLISEVCRKYHLGARWGLFSDHESLINADLGSPNHMVRSVSPPGETQKKEEPSKKPKRLKSLDTVRGISLTIMIFVNFGGGGYYYFHHSRWNGLTVADLVFPWFMWIMGVSISLSFRVLRRRQVKNSTILIKIIRRTIVLFALGLFTSNFGDLQHYRIPGVLQRFAACYFMVALVQLLSGSGSTEDTQPRGVWWDPIRDVVVLWAQWLFMLALLVIYLVVTYAIEIDGCPRGYTGPGGIGLDYPEAQNCTGGAASSIDKWLFKDHVYQGGTFQDLYRTTIHHDPEGALGTITSIFLVFLGVQAGQTLFTYTHHKPRVIRWLIWAVILGCLAIGLSSGTKNEGIVPMNKNLWSVSFIFATGSMAFILLAFCYVTEEVLEIWNGAPFIYPGMNSILVYCGHELLGEHFPFSWTLDKYHTHADELLMNVVGTSCWVAISYYLYWIEFFVKI